MKNFYLMSKIIIFIITGFLSAKSEISGYMFGDYYYVFLHHDTTDMEGTPSLIGQNGFWLRRVYFTYKYKISKKLSVKFRLEANSPDFYEVSSSLSPFIKDAYLKWEILKNNFFVFGLSPTPTWSLVVEKHWGYRSIEKTLLDLHKFGSSRDIGVALRGAFDKDKKIRYHLMLGNGEGKKSEFNKGKKIMFSLGFHTEKFILEGYADWKEQRGYTDLITYQVFMGLKLKKLRSGFLFSGQIRQKEPDTNMVYELFSFYFVYDFIPKWSFILRYDKVFDPNPKASKISYLRLSDSAPYNLFLLGTDFKVHEFFHIMPNIEYVFYNEYNDIKPKSVLLLKLTFYYKWR